jgi:aldehyde:ferredoxin oxidoreductase
MTGLGKILKIDLSTGKIDKETIPLELRHKYLGGGGINDWLLWKYFLDVDPNMDPLTPENVFIIGAGLLEGVGYGIGGKVKWTFKSPITNLFGDSASGGKFGSTLKWAGYDHVVITGRADKPVYIWIDDDQVEIRDASHIWGKDTLAAARLIEEELGDAEIETALIGNAGENLVRYSSIMVSRHRCGGRAGGGTVMGSKNLKGLAVRGTKGIRIHDPKAMIDARDELLGALDKDRGFVDVFRRFGTTGLSSWYNRIGINALRNNQSCILPSDQLHQLHHRFYTENLAVAPLSCPGCVIGCSNTYKIKGSESPAAKLYEGETWTRPEYGGIAGLGIMCGIADWPAICHFWFKCDLYSIDVIELGACLGLLMELWQRGIVTEKDTKEWFGEPVSLEWGNIEAVDRIIDAVALQENELGRILSEGVYKAAQKIEAIKGVPVLQYALYGKGGAGFIEDVRNTPSWATNMAVASRGADHLKGLGTLDKVNDPEISTYYFGKPEGAEPFTTTFKGASSAFAENRCALINCLGICIFSVGSNPLNYPNEMFARAIHAATGMKLSGEELLLAGERTVNLEKAFNSRLGLRRGDDILCERWLKEPMPDGPGKGWKAEDYIEETKSEYYEFHGWDAETSLQTKEKLMELDMGDVADILGQENALV